MDTQPIVLAISVGAFVVSVNIFCNGMPIVAQLKRIATALEQRNKSDKEQP